MWPVIAHHRGNRFPITSSSYEIRGLLIGWWMEWILLYVRNDGNLYLYINMWRGNIASFIQPLCVISHNIFITFVLSISNTCRDKNTKMWRFKETLIYVHKYKILFLIFIYYSRKKNCLYFSISLLKSSPPPVLHKLSYWWMYFKIVYNVLIMDVVMASKCVFYKYKRAVP